MEEIASFKAHGQQQPVKGRLVHDDPSYDIEVFCGARRLFVARILRVPLLVDVCSMSDRDAVIAMHISSLHKDLSPYELGLGYLEWIRSGLFRTQEDLTTALAIAPAKLSRLLKLARLPSVVVEAFRNGVDLREDWGVKLAEILEDPAKKAPAIRAARTLASRTSNLRPDQIYQRLLMAAAPTEAGHHKVAVASHDQVIQGEDGYPLFRIRHQRDSIALLLPISNTSVAALDAIRQAVKSILTGTGRRPVAGQKNSNLGASN